MKDKESQGKALDTLDTGQELNRGERRAVEHGKSSTGKSGAGRTRVFAIVVYPDSAPEDWQERLTQEHVQVLISPLHDRDTNPDGELKKAHWHVLIMFDSVKTQEQVDAMLDRVLGPDRVKHFENVNSTRGYARYLCHKDNPEKAQYADSDVIALGGADYQELVQLGSDDRSTLRMVFAYIREHNIRYYDDLIDACLENDLQSMFALITEKRTLAVVHYLRAKTDRRRDKREERQWASVGMQVDPETGELLGPIPLKEDREEIRDDDCQD